LEEKSSVIEKLNTLIEKQEKEIKQLRGK